MNAVIEIEEFILKTGAAAMALSAIFGFAILMVRMFVLKPIEQQLTIQTLKIKSDFDSRLAEMEKVADVRHEETTERYRHVEYELRANGGGSLKDDVRKLKHKVEDLHREIVVEKAIREDRETHDAD